jgi:MFS family permease
MSAAVSDFWLFLFSRLMQGVGSAMWITGRQTLLSDILKPSERGRILGYFQTFQLIGSATGPAVGGFVSEIWNIQAPFYLYALLGIISLVLTVLMVHEAKIIKDRREGDNHFSPQVIKRILMNRTFCMACLATFSIFLLTTGIRQMMISVYAKDTLKLGNLEIGTIISFITFMNLIMTVPMGYMIDYYGRKSVILKSLFIAAVSCLLFAFTYDFISISLVAVLLGFGTSGAQQAPLAMATDVTINEPHGMSIGLYRLFGDIGFIVGPILMGAIADYYLDLKMPFYYMAALLFVNAMLLLIFAKETYRQKRDKDKGDETSKN